MRALGTEVRDPPGPTGPCSIIQVVHAPQCPFWVMCGRLPVGKGCFEVDASWSDAMTLLFKRDMDDPAPLLATLAKEMPEREIRIFPDVEPIADIEYALVYEPPPGLLTSLPNLKAIFSLWAGTDHMASDPELPAVPVIRMVDRCMTATMTVHVVQQVLDLHTQSAIYRTQQAERHWEEAELTAPWNRRVGFLPW